MSHSNMVCGVGLNDAGYPVYRAKRINGVLKIIWRCPFAVVWKSMLERCYLEKRLQKFPTYRGCSVAPEWLRFSNFREWMVSQDWENKVLDKDLLIPGNRVYRPQACVFLEPRVNAFLNENKASRGKWPLGVSFHKRDRRFYANCGSVETGKTKFLGIFDTPEAAHEAWRDYKLQQAWVLASQQTDIRVAAALLARFPGQ